VSLTVEPMTGHPLRRLRQARRLAQAGVAVRAGCSPTTILLIERWGHVPSPPVQKKIAEALHVQVADIWPESAHEDDA
jgi:DNA-binding XRE family transcriptional regulator